MHSIDYNLFNVLLTIYQQGSVSKAADILHLTQPAVSHALARCRAYFDDALFERHGRKMVATDYCQRIIGDVENSLTTLQQTVVSPKEWQPEKLDRTFNIAVRDLLEALVFPRLMARLQALAPQVRVKNHSIEPKDLPGALTHGEIDLALDTLFAAPGTIKNQILGSNNFVLVCRQHHPIMQQCDLAAYQCWPHVVAALKASDINLVDNALTAQQLHRNVILRCENFYSAAQVVSHSDLLMTAPATAARQLAQHLPLQILPLPLSLPDISIHLYWWKMAGSDPAIMWLKQQMLDIATTLFKDV